MITQPAQVFVAFSEQPFGGVMVQTPTGLELLAISGGPPGPPGPPGPVGPDGPTTGFITGTAIMVNGQAYVDVTFPVPQDDINWLGFMCNVVNLIDPDPLVLTPGTIILKTSLGCRVLLNGAPDSGNYFLQWGLVATNPGPPPVATFYSMTGPDTGEVDVESTDFTVSLPGGSTVPAPVEITPDDGGDGGTFSPTSVTLTTGSPVATFKYTPASAGSTTISVTNDGGLTDPSPIVMTVSAGTAHLLNGLVSYWRCNEGSGVTKADSQDGNDASDPTSCASFAFIIENGAYFTSGNNWLVVPDDVSLHFTSDFFFSVWVRVDNAAATKVILAKFDGATSDYGITHDSATGFHFGAGDMDASVGSPAGSFSTHHLVGWFDSSDNKVRLRVDDATTYVSSAGSLNTPNTGTLKLGAIIDSSNASNWEGLFGQCGVWNRKPTAADITALFNGGSGLPYSSFTA